MANIVNFKFRPGEMAFVRRNGKITYAQVATVAYDDVHNVQIYTLTGIDGEAFTDKDLGETVEEILKDI